MPKMPGGLMTASLWPNAAQQRNDRNRKKQDSKKPGMGKNCKPTDVIIRLKSGTQPVKVHSPSSPGYSLVVEGIRNTDGLNKDDVNEANSSVAMDPYNFDKSGEYFDYFKKGMIPTKGKGRTSCNWQIEEALQIQEK